jgi:hypothetical protein
VLNEGEERSKRKELANRIVEMQHDFCFEITCNFVENNIMATITVKINERSGIGKAIMELLISTAKEKNIIEIIDFPGKEVYSKSFEQKVLKSDKNDKRIRIETKDLWDSI